MCIRDRFGLPVSRVCRSYQTHSLTVRLVDDRDAGRGLTLPPFDGGVDLSLIHI